MPSKAHNDKGIEVKANGTYIVVAPSVINGVPYKFLNELEPAPMPQELTVFLRKKKATPGANNNSCQSPTIEGVPEGARDTQLFLYACSLRAKGLSKEETKKLVLVKAERCTPPFPYHEAHKKVESAWKYAKDFALTDLGNAQRLVDSLSGEFRYVPQFGRWLYWDGYRWARDTDGEIVRRAGSVVDLIICQSKNASDESLIEKLRKHAKSTGSRRSIEAMVQLAKTEPGIPIDAAKLDADPMLFGVPNGYVDLTSGDLYPPVPERFITKLAGTRFDPDADCPTWKKFAEQVCDGDKELVEYLQRSVGYSLTGRTTEQCPFFSVGHRRKRKKHIFECHQKTFGRLRRDYPAGVIDRPT